MMSQRVLLLHLNPCRISPLSPQKPPPPPPAQAQTPPVGGPVLSQKLQQRQKVAAPGHSNNITKMGGDLSEARTVLVAHVNQSELSCNFPTDVIKKNKKHKFHFKENPSQIQAP
ncbi:hypothetical protein GDO81_015024 [Engystomops pustulosus]|uniref:Uncharacterized protein n=1 Tax=Engystomops pustulosus TaxID=76066 RepID=A0AAV7AM87_ENGPU|nr:hypothetical protein GDO81_015024 [Engystomops pustulosus]